MGRTSWQTCSQCDRKMERCRAASVDENGVVEWVCRQCWKDLNYDQYLYEHKVKDEDKS